MHDLRFHTLLRLAALVSLVAAISTPAMAARKKDIPNPDFTNGEPIPEGASKDWTLGATGARGWIYSHDMETSQARQIRITEVAEDSPANGVLKVGDVILGIGEDAFSYDARRAFGEALTVAESNAGGGQLELLRWREGDTEIVTVELPVLGDYSSTAPYGCTKSARILKQGCRALAEKIMSPDYNPNPISRSLNALALLATGDKTWMPAIKQEAEWASNYSAFKFSTWYYGYVITFLAEYVMATGDESVMPGLRRLALESAEGQSIVGSWGHRFAGDDGRLVGYGMMNAPGVPLTISLELARRAGVDDPKIPLAIERSMKLLRFYTGKGAVPYGDHDPWMHMHDDNGKCGMAAVLFNLLEEEEGAKFFSRMSLASFGNGRDTGHTGNFWNMTWAMPGVNQSGPHATGAWMQEFGTWYYDLARGHDGLFRHQGPPQARPDSTAGWDATGAFLLAYAMPIRQLYMTGKQQPTTPQLTAAEAEEIIDDGRGWTNSNRYGRYLEMSTDELLQRLGSWSPIVRERAAVALAKRDDPPIDDIIDLLDSNSLETRIGACQALAQLKGKAQSAVPELRETLEADDMWLRINAAQALGAIGGPAKVAAEDLLQMLVREPGPEDPRAMEQRYLCFALFSNRGGLLSDSLDGVDPDLLREAVRAGLRNQDGRARHTLTAVYEHLSDRELNKLLPDVLYSVVNPSPSGIMFADSSRLEGLRMLGEWKVAEGIDACMYYLKNLNHWGSQKRVPEILEVLQTYGVHARRTIPELEELADYFAAGKPTYFPEHLSKGKAEDVREAIEYLQNTDDKPELMKVL
ncbi:DUF6288 domain-containing protein [Coraliomargarita sinensis]|nr:DUF6288 domain-containing protein [Coraliomargarita sinensis]